MIDAGALRAARGSADIVEIALRVEYEMHQRFGEEAKLHASADDAEFGLEYRDGTVRSAHSPMG